MCRISQSSRHSRTCLKPSSPLANWLSTNLYHSRGEWLQSITISLPVFRRSIDAAKLRVSLKLNVDVLPAHPTKEKRTCPSVRSVVLGRLLDWSTQLGYLTTRPREIRPWDRVAGPKVQRSKQEDLRLCCYFVDIPIIMRNMNMLFYSLRLYSTLYYAKVWLYRCKYLGI